jgi:endoglucanase
MRDWRSILARVPGLLVTAAVATLAASNVWLHSTDPAIARPTATVVAATATAAPTATPAATATPAPTPTPVPIGTGPLRADGGTLVDDGGRAVRLTGVNWSGMETSAFAPIGLTARNVDDMLDQIVAAGFNTLRLPFSNQLLDATVKRMSINYSLNERLKGLNGLGLLDYVVNGAGRRGLRVILDRHRPTADGQTELWYTSQVPEKLWIQDWLMLARRYRGNQAVIGADLTNEPHGAATWGDDNLATDWRLAAERAGNAILDVNPDWLIIVEGVQHVGVDTYWWGGNLSAAALAPVRLSRPERLVYSAHDYGPEESAQSWLQARDFPNNLPGVWRDRWAYLQEQNIAPVLVGEFGGRSIAWDAEGVWQRSLVSFLEQGGFSYTYWVWNPDAWIGGLLLDNRGTVDRAKIDLLRPSMAALLGKPTSGRRTSGIRQRFEARCGRCRRRSRSPSTGDCSGRVHELAGRHHNRLNPRCLGGMAVIGHGECAIARAEQV